MNDFIDRIFGILFVCLAIFILVATWAMYVEVKKDISISNNNDAHNVQVLRIKQE